MTVSDSLVPIVTLDRAKRIANRSESRTIYYAGKNFGPSPIHRPWGTHRDLGGNSTVTGRETRDLRPRYSVLDQNIRVVWVIHSEPGSPIA